MAETWLEQVGLGVTLWEGGFEGKQDIWLRWRDLEGNVLRTGDELAEQAGQRAQQAGQRAELAEQRAEQAEQLAQQLAEQLRALGIDPDTLT